MPFFLNEQGGAYEIEKRAFEKMYLGIKCSAEV